MSTTALLVTTSSNGCRNFQILRLAQCPSCAGTGAEADFTISLPSQGEGWYVTDYARKGSHNGKNKASDATESKTTEASASDSSSLLPPKRAPKKPPKLPLLIRPLHKSAALQGRGVGKHDASPFFLSTAYPSCFVRLERILMLKRGFSRNAKIFLNCSLEKPASCPGRMR